MSFLDAAFEIDAATKSKILEELDKRKHEFEKYPELEELEEMIKA